MLKRSLFLFSVFFSNMVQAEIIDIPTGSGFSGFIMGGGGGIDYKSNMFKGPNDDNKHHNGLYNSPESHSLLIPVYGVDFRYTFADTRTQIFFGNLIQDAVRFDFTQQLGIRQQISDKGILSLGYVFPLMPSKTWKNPYSRGERDETDTKFGGGRISWDQVWGTSFNVAYTERRFSIDDEYSGENLGLSSSERGLLNRNGSTHEMAFSYNWLLPHGHLLHPEIVYTKADLDGRAMSYDKTTLQLTYGYNNPQWSIISNFFRSQLKYDETNPIYEKKADGSELGINGTFFWHNFAGITSLNGFISASYSKSDSDIIFYDSYVKSLNTGLLYRF